MLKRKFILELDDEPALLFVLEKGKRYPVIYQDGKELKGARSIRIQSSVGDLTTHQVEFYSNMPSGK